MLYIYDILLNFNNNLIEYFEWEDSDSIKYVKKALLFKISSNMINDIIKNEIILDSSFVSTIPKYEMNGAKDASSLCLFTDGMIAIGTLIKNNKIVGISRLIIDEEREVIEESESLNITNIGYQVVENKNIENKYLTRKEKEEKRKLKEEIEKLYKEKKEEKLMYLYYEYTENESKNIEHIYTYLIKSLEGYNIKHRKLYEIISLSNANLK